MKQIRNTPDYGSSGTRTQGEKATTPGTMGQQIDAALSNRIDRAAKWVENGAKGSFGPTSGQGTRMGSDAGGSGAGGGEGSILEPGTE